MVSTIDDIKAQQMRANALLFEIRREDNPLIKAYDMVENMQAYLMQQPNDEYVQINF